MSIISRRISGLNGKISNMSNLERVTSRIDKQQNKKVNKIIL